MDNLRDKFSSDEEYENFKNMFKSYKEQNMSSQYDELRVRATKLEKLIYKNFMLDNLKYFRIPSDIVGNNLGMYMFNLQKMSEGKIVLTIILN